MKIFFPGWACDKEIFKDYIDKDSYCYDWGFFSKETSKLPDLKKHFIIYAYSLGTLKALEIAQSPYCKAMIIFSGFYNFCSEKSNVLKLKLMQQQLLNNPRRLLENFSLQACGKTKQYPQRDYLSITHLSEGLNYLHNNYKDYLKNISCPTIIFTGLKDKIAPFRQQESLFKKIKNSKLIIYPQAMHNLLLDSSKDCIKQINNFLN